MILMICLHLECTYLYFLMPTSLFWGWILSGGSRQTTELKWRQSWILTMLFGDSVHIEFSFLVYVFQALFDLRGLLRAVWSEHTFSCFCSAASSSLNTSLHAHPTAASNRLHMLSSRPLHTQRTLPGRFFLQTSTWFFPSLSSRLCSCFILLEKTTLSFPSSLCFFSTTVFKTCHAIFFFVDFLFPNTRMHTLWGQGFVYCCVLRTYYCTWHIVDVQ